MINLTVITVCYNCKKDLLKTINSVKQQDNQNFEYIIIDGGSTDGTLEVIKDNLIYIDNYVSEIDNGIYDAMNKGINLSNGQNILFLNSGDIFADPKVTDSIISNKSQWDVLYGDVILENSKRQAVKYQPKELTLNYLFINNLCHQSMIFKKYLFSDIGLFDTDEFVFADYKLLLTIFKSNKKLFI
ncbi:glycosyltransferase family 2 protein [Gottfriedia acidiceleris]|uniref:glycosyltransferase family 2 protein n=1 Tax=Gottfriedia acidiceleris TaxID=371036 RepID=UPI002FFF5B92